jgi:ABC-type multidrug transport system fused ATPase/permease subunit
MLARSWRNLFVDPSGTPALIRRIFVEQAINHWRRYAITLAFMALGAACSSSGAYLFGYGINQSYVNRSFPGVAFVAIAAVIISALRGVAAYGQAVTIARISNHMLAGNQRRIFEKLIHQDAAYYADRHSSEFAARLTYGAGAPGQVMALLVNTLGRDLLSLIALAGVMVYQDPLLSMFAFVLMPPAILGVRNLVKRVRAITLTQFGGGAEILKSMQETVQGFRIIKAFNLEESVRARVYDSIAAVEQASNKLARVSNRSTPLMESLGGIAIGLIFLYGGYRVLVQNNAPGEFMSFVVAFLLAYEPAKRIARLNIDLHNALTGVRIFYDLIDTPDAKPAVARPDVKIERGHIAFDEVSFGYRANTPVLRDMSFVAEPGEVTAFVGPSGGGKTTIFNLVLALYAPTRGAIRLDGQDYRSVSAESIRRQIAYVGQDVFLFHGTIRYNIALGRLGATDAEIVAAAKAAHADDFISQFPAGYDTHVGEQGAQLSGGQRQRISIARALIRNAPIILLDEPTAALDSESERVVQDAMGKLIKGRTTLVIAHRLHTVIQANMIHVVENGAIVESGRHSELLARSGRYAHFYLLRLSRDAATDVRDPVSIVPG